jgi:hypothetical protein
MINIYNLLLLEFEIYLWPMAKHCGLKNILQNHKEKGRIEHGEMGKVER